MAGSITLSLSQQVDANGKPLAGGKLYIFAVGTTTPQNAYTKPDLLIARTHPMVADANGRLPSFWLADGYVRARLTDANGVLQFDEDSLLVVGPSGGVGGGDTPVSASALAATGDIKARYGTGVLDGWVRMNGRTMGPVVSGATERAHADTQPLYEYLWSLNDPNCPVAGGRGASAAADWAANKAITLPSFEGCALGFLDDMGGGARGRLTTATFATAGQGPTVLGAIGGAEKETLLATHLPVHHHSIPAHDHGNIPVNKLQVEVGGNDTSVLHSDGPGAFGGTELDVPAAPAAETGDVGSNTPHNNVQKTALATAYLKL